MKAIETIFRWINMLVILATLLAYLAPFINPAKDWHFSVLALGYPVFLLFNIFFVVFWLVRRRRYFLFSLGCILVGFGHLTGLIGFHFFKNSSRSGNEMTVMTYNTSEFTLPKNRTKEWQEGEFKKLRRFLKEEGSPQIFCTQEVLSGKAMDSIKAIFGFEHYYRSKGTVIFSSFPFVKYGSLDITNSCVWADLKTPKGLVRVYSVHLQSNRLTYTATRIATEGDLREKETWKDIRFVLARYKLGAQIRAEQAKILAEHMAQSPHPVILCGDLNDTPITYTYRILSKDLQDSFREKGTGIGSTFAGKLPTLRIDYVFAGKAFQVSGHRVPDVELSDHFPVWVSLKW